MSQHDWVLNPALFKYLDRVWGPHTMDRCTSMCNRQLEVYNSLFYKSATLVVNCLAQQDRAAHNNFVNPPFCILSRILDVIMRQRAVAMVIALAPPICIPNNRHAMWGMCSLPESRKNSQWKVYAWRVCGQMG